MDSRIGLLMLVAGCTEKPLSPDASVQNSQKLLGRWQTSCLSEQDRLQIDFSLGVISQVQFDEDCSTQSFVVRMSGTISAPPTLIDNELIEIDFVLDRIEYEARKTETAEFFNERKFGGFDDWRVGVRRDITCRAGLPCEGNTLRSLGRGMDGALLLELGRWNAPRMTALGHPQLYRRQ